jgi:hypothetical protein
MKGLCFASGQLRQSQPLSKRRIETMSRVTREIQAMTEPFVVEVWGKPAGVVVKEGNAFRFHALARPFFALDGAQFTTRGHARLAAAQLVAFDRPAAEEAYSGVTGRSLGRASQSASFCPL